jgi:Flp pilus assembly protein TadG
MRIGSLFHRRFANDRRGMAAVEFALIAPALIFIVMGVFEMSLRFRAANEATRYVHEIADLVARDNTSNSADLKSLYDASTEMMMPVTSTNGLSLDVVAIGYKANTNKDPYILWRRYSGSMVDFSLDQSNGLADSGESVLRVGLRYQYKSVLTTLFGGPTMAIERYAYARPRDNRLIQMDGMTDMSAQGAGATPKLIDTF